MNVYVGKSHAVFRAIVGVLAVGMVAMTMLLAVGRGQQAHAEEVPATITVSTTKTTVGQWDRVDFLCNWQVPDHSKPGDTFSMVLPEELKWMGAKSFNLVAPDGVTPVAKAEVTGGPPWVVTFTLTDYVTTHPINVKGTCKFSTQYVKTIEEGEVVDLDFDVSGNVSTVPVTGENPCPNGCQPPPARADKWMWWTDVSDQRRTRSVLFSPETPIDDTTVQITDTPQAGIAIDCASVQVLVGDSRSGDGRVVADMTATYPDPAHIQCTPAGLTATWELPAGWYMNVIVDSVVIDSSLTEYTNNGTVSLNGEEASTISSSLDRSDASGNGEGESEEPTPTPTDEPTTPGPTTPEPTDEPSTPEPTDEPSTPEPTDEPSTPEPTEQPPTTSTGELPNTGAEFSMWWVLVAALLILSGGALITITSRKS